MDDHFPLTPALSPAERENRIPPHKKLCGWIGRTVIRKTSEHRWRFPLPEGEGQGEGERGLQMITAA
jgi:hypothetical protein